MKLLRKWTKLFLVMTLLVVLSLVGCSSAQGKNGGTTGKSVLGQEQPTDLQVTEDGEYTQKDQVALYIHTYGHLPDNFISKTKARKLGWVSSEGNLEEAAPGKSIGGSVYKNYDQALPEKKGRTYTECDINYEGGFRGPERIIFSNDGLVYYTEDHYKTFELLYGEE